MDLIYMNRLFQDGGVLVEPEYDLAFGKDENDFSCTIHSSNHCCEPGFFIYAEGTEYGGIVDNIEVDTEADTVTYSGRTWHGILSSKIIMPTDGASLVISGDANDCVESILQRIGLPSALFTVPEEAAGVQITEYQFDRYTDAYTGIRKMLASAGLRLQITHFDGQVVLSAVPQYDFSQDEEFESELVAFRSKTHYNKVNHLICLGAGEGADRIIVHLYMDENGNVSQTQTFFGVDEYVAAYDKTGSLKTTADEGVTEEDVAADRAEKTADLIEDGTEKLKDMQTSDEISIDFDFDSDNYFVGDIVGSYDGNTGISVAAEITKKIVTIEGGQVKISYKVG